MNRWLHLCGLLLAWPASAASPLFGLTLLWDAPPDPDIARYSLYWRSPSETYATNRMVTTTNTSALVTNLVPGSTNFFTVSAWNVSGLESDFAAELRWVAPSRPGVPGRLRIGSTNLYSARIEFDARAGYAYQVEQAGSVLGPWTGLATLLTEGDLRVGLEPYATGTQAYFRYQLEGPE